MASREQAVALRGKEHGQRLWSVQELVSSLRLAWTKAYTMNKEFSKTCTFLSMFLVAVDYAE